MQGHCLYYSGRWLWIFFFFQAEDGIRDKLVTGVQTCALPISRRPGHHLDAQNLLGRAVEDELEVAAVLAGRPPVRRARDVVPGDVTLDPAARGLGVREPDAPRGQVSDRKSTRLNSSH